MDGTIRAVLDTLDSFGVNYELAEHGAVRTIDELAAMELPHKEAIAKNLFLRDDKKRNYYLVSIHEEKRADLKALRHKLGSRPLSFASGEDLAALLGLEKGSVTPLGILNDRERRVAVCIDAAFSGGLIGVHPNKNTATVFLNTEELVNLLRRHGNPVEFVEL